VGRSRWRLLRVFQGRNARRVQLGKRLIAVRSAENCRHLAVRVGAQAAADNSSRRVRHHAQDIPPTGGARRQGVGGQQRKGDNMGSAVIIMVIVVCAGGIVWWRRRSGYASTAAVSSERRPREKLALKAFAHGNTCLMEGKFAEATAAFHQALKLEPKHPHIAGRLAEVDRRQQAANANSPV